MEKKLDTSKPSYSEDIRPVPWPFVISRLNCILFLIYVLARHVKQISMCLRVCLALSFPLCVSRLPRRLILTYYKLYLFGNTSHGSLKNQFLKRPVFGPTSQSRRSLFPFQCHANSSTFFLPFSWMCCMKVTNERK